MRGPLPINFTGKSMKGLFLSPQGGFDFDKDLSYPVELSIAYDVTACG